MEGKKLEGKKLPEGLFCQSCGMPFDAEGDMGTNKDGSPNSSYCKFCYTGGAFTEPDITMAQMVEKIVGIMKHIDRSDEAKIREMAESFVPHLARWSGKHGKKKGK
ncbi:MAG: zinc ribbon domain-containing protein [Deltaproteobacteria bacterium]|nr:zinc ribbon domain-containing protein [Deltaproteobacteria bacterium]